MEINSNNNNNNNNNNFCCLREQAESSAERDLRSDAGHRPPLESEKVLSGTSARRVWYEDGRDNYHHGSWGRKTLQIPGGARERSTG